MKDHTYPEEHKNAHWLRALERMKKDRKVIDDYFKRLVDKVRKDKKDAMHAARYSLEYKRVDSYNYFEQSKSGKEPK